MDLKTTTKSKTDRYTKGVAFVDLVKVLKIYRRKCPLAGISRATEALFDEHILPTKWYPHESFLELLDIAYSILLGSDEQNTVQMGVNGGLGILKGVHGAFVREGDAIGSVIAMRHIWPTYYTFGRLNAELVESQKVRFSVVDYPDVTKPHALVIIGWGIAAARLGGALETNYGIFERPWDGAYSFKYWIDIGH